ncbi:hypothetical protein AAFC00_005956 [Neodothiora populina]|uniref:Large ribosomal subunit protein mL50 n=1 Tax=Neodothiora populina TaxID=2781224 RepID=A0ABR3P6H3_9PEZI
MRITASLERSLGQLVTPAPTHRICRSCRLQGATFQRRQIQSTTNRAGFFDRFRGKKKEEETDLAELESESAELQRVEPEEVLPEGWAKSPDQDPNYIEATSWDELEQIGSDTWVEDQYDPGDEYTGWNKPMSKSTKVKDSNVEAILFPIARQVFKGLKQTPEKEWLGQRLTEPKVKLQLAKLLQQQNGLRISDYALNSAATLRDIRSVLVVKPKPKKLATALQSAEQLVELPNVKVHARRVTPIDKERTVGRWKLIEQELLERGLPVTGHNGRV